MSSWPVAPRWSAYRSRGSSIRPHRLPRVTRRQSPPAIERGEEPAAGRLPLAAPVPLELAAHERVVAPEQVPPAAVAHLGGLEGGVDDVGEHHRREDAIDVLRRTGSGQKLLRLAED